MTHFAGLFLKREETPEERYCEELKNGLSRRPGERIREFVSGGLYVCHFDISGEPNNDRIETEERFTLVCGMPLVLSGADAAADKQELARRLTTDEGLLAARGVFCGMTFDRRRREIRLFTDRLGIRPFYYYEDDRLIVFSTVLRTLVGCSFCSIDIDLLGLMETVRFGGGVGARTAFAQVRVACPAEVLRINHQVVASSVYWRWDEIEPLPCWPKNAASELYERFRDAILLRRGLHTEEYAFLSGGMDSRAIVSMLQAVGAEPRTYCFLPTSTLDGAFAAQYAKAARIQHVTRPHFRVVIPEVQGLMARELRARLGRNAVLPQVWSGDGGSVGLGHVYMEQTAVEALREGQIDEAIRRFLAYLNYGLPRGILTEASYERLRAAMPEVIRDEIQTYNPVSRERWLFYFMLRNEQRAHLRGHFEEIDLNRIEQAQPFFDWDFLAYVCSLPIDDCLWHKAYSRFFELLPASARSVPWQTYPAHAPCPLPLPKGVPTQWERKPHWQWRLRRKALDVRALRYVLSSRFPTSLLNRGGILIRALADLSLLSDRHFEITPVALCAEMARHGREVVMADQG